MMLSRRGLRSFKEEDEDRVGLSDWKKEHTMNRMKKYFENKKVKRGK